AGRHPDAQRGGGEALHSVGLHLRRRRRGPWFAGARGRRIGEEIQGVDGKGVERKNYFTIALHELPLSCYGRNEMSGFAPGAPKRRPGFSMGPLGAADSNRSK